MRLYGLYTPSHERLKEDWFLASLKDAYEICLTRYDSIYGGAYRQPQWSKAIKKKSEVILQAIQDNWNNLFVYSDVDVQFFGPTEAKLIAEAEGRDIVCQVDHLTDANLCAGFFICRGNRKTLELWTRVRKCLKKEGRDQGAFNRLLRNMREIKYGALPLCFFGGGSFSGRIWEPGDDLFVPADAVMHHANWTVGIANKIEQLKYVKTKLSHG